MSSILSKRNKSPKEFFSSFAETWDSLYGYKRNVFMRILDNALRRDIYERYQITFNKLGNDLKGKTILDIGCGSGVYSFEAARRGAQEVVGVDVAENMISLSNYKAKDLGLDNLCKFLCSDFPSDQLLKTSQCKYNFTIVMGVMDYVQDALYFLKAVRSLTESFAILSFPGKHWFREPLRRFRYRLLGRCEIYTYSEMHIRGLFNQCGFSHIEIKFLSHSGGCYIVTAYP